MLLCVASLGFHSSLKVVWKKMPWLVSKKWDHVGVLCQFVLAELLNKRLVGFNILLDLSDGMVWQASKMFINCCWKVSCGWSPALTACLKVRTNCSAAPFEKGCYGALWLCYTTWELLTLYHIWCWSWGALSDLVNAILLYYAIGGTLLLLQWNIIYIYICYQNSEDTTINPILCREPPVIRDILNHVHVYTATRILSATVIFQPGSRGMSSCGGCLSTKQFNIPLIQQYVHTLCFIV